MPGPGRLEASRPREAKPRWSASSEVGHGRRVTWERVVQSDQLVIALSSAAALSSLSPWFPTPFVGSQALAPQPRCYRKTTASSSVSRMPALSRST